MDKNPDVRWRQRLQSFRKAFSQLSKAAATARERGLSSLEKQGLIKAFEFTHELAWNVLKDFLESRGTAELYGSRDATREGFAKGLIEDGEAWMQMIQSRNRTIHTYNERLRTKSRRQFYPVTCRSLKSFSRNSRNWRNRRHEHPTRAQ